MAMFNSARKDLPIITGAEMCKYVLDENGEGYCEVCGKMYNANFILETYGTIHNTDLPTEYGQLDLLIDERHTMNYMAKRIDEFDVYKVYVLLEDLYLDRNNWKVSPVGQIVGAWKLEGYEKKEAYENLNSWRGREIIKALKKAFDNKQRQLDELMEFTIEKEKCSENKNS